MKIDSPSTTVRSSQRTRRVVLLSAMLLGAPAFSAGAWTMLSWWTPQPDEVWRIALSDEAQVTVDVFWPQAASQGNRCGAVLLLPGVEGAVHGAPHHFPRARQLANEGHAVFVVHYLEPCGYDHLYLLRKDGTLDTKAIDAFAERDRHRWIDAVTGALTNIAGRPEIDPERIAVLGYSLGCFVAISSAEVANHRDEVPDVVALVGHWGAKFEDAQLDASFPRCRFFHGQCDEIVPVEWARETVAELQAAGVDAELRVFEGEGHIVRNRLAWKATRAFIQDALRPIPLAPTMVDQSAQAFPMISADGAKIRNLCF